MLKTLVTHVTQPHGSCLALLCAVGVMTLLSAHPTNAEDYPQLALAGASSHHALLDMSIEELMQIDVSLVSRKPEPLQSAASAITVITAEDIRLSGVTSIPEALRLVPGLHVARPDANTWAISSRGFNGRFARQMLVKIDGRTVYTPLFSGVIWEAQDVLLDDIDRIEVIRGPGATLWGANAVSGVINIVTKSARETQGSLASGAIGTELEYAAAARHGAALGDQAWVRTYAKTEAYDAGRRISGGSAEDDWRRTQIGFRLDWEPAVSDTITVQGDYYESELGQVVLLPDPDSPAYTRTVTEEPEMLGGNLLLRWDHRYAHQNDVSLQFYYDYFERNEAIIGDKQDTLDLDLQHRVTLGGAHHLTWGGGYRIVYDDLRPSPALTFTDADRTEERVNGFVQDEIRWLDDRLRTTFGTRVEHNDYTGTEWQPTVRLAYQPVPHKTLWAAVSRAVRTPSRLERTMQLTRTIPENWLFPGSPAGMGILDVSDEFDSEKVIAYEIGYRTHLGAWASADIAAFLNTYDDLMTLEPIGMTDDGVLLARLDNRMKGTGHGVEISAQWQALEWWRLEASWTLAALDLELEDSSLDLLGVDLYEDDLPQNQASLFSVMSLPADLALTAWLRYVDAIPFTDIEAYTTLDLRLGWQPTETLELELVGQNLLEDSIQEYGLSSVVTTEVTEMERSVYGKVTLWF